MTILSRQELYELVWKDAIRTVAANYGVSDVWLKKVCAKADIPTPDRGYWAKLAAGKPVVKAKLPLRGPGMSDEVAVTKAILYVHVGDEVMDLALDHPDAKPNRWGEWSTRPGPADTLKLELKPRHTQDIPQRIWIDSDDGKLEDLLTEIVVAFGVAGEAHYRQRQIAYHTYLLKRRVENEAEVAKRRAEAERRERERRLQAEKERRDRLFAQARDWRSAQDIRGFVDDVLKSHAADHAALEDWAKWARTEADALNPALNGSLTPADLSS